MLETLDALIATVGVVFVLSLIVQAVQQIIKQLFSFKSRYMERELMSLFGAEKGTFLGRTFALTDLPAPLAAMVTRGSEQNATITQLIDGLKRQLAGLGYNDLSLLETIGQPEFQRILTVVADGLKPAGKTALLSDEGKAAKAAIDKALKGAGEWFDLTLRSFQDHYERRMKLWAYLLSFILVSAMNADLFDVYREFQSSRVLRQSALQATAGLVESYEPPDISDPASLEEWKSGVSLQLDLVDSLVSIRSFQLWRWDAPGRDTLMLTGPESRSAAGYFVEGTWNHFPGLVVMTLLVGLGAPFWYDILKAVMGLKQRAQGNVRPGATT